MYKVYTRLPSGGVRNYIDTDTGEVISARKYRDITAQTKGRRSLEQQEKDRAKGWGYDSVYQYRKSTKLHAKRDYKIAGTSHYGYELGSGASLDDLKRRIEHSLDESKRGDRFQIIGRKGKGGGKDQKGFSTPPVGLDDLDLAISYAHGYADRYELDMTELDIYIEYIEDW